MAINPKNFTQQADCNGRGIPGVHNTNWVTTSNASATTCTASKAAVSGDYHIITGIIVHSDTADATVTVAQGTTTKVITALSTDPLVVNFASPIILAVNTTAYCTVSGATSACYANMTGFSISLKT